VTIPAGSAGDREYTANWTLVYSISYILDGGSFEGGYPASYTAADYVALVDPARPGYIFLGWTWDGQDVPALGLTIPSGSTGDRVFTAHWGDEADTYYELKFFNPADFNQIGYTRMLRAGDAFTPPELPPRTGYELIDWSSELYSSEPYLGTTMPEGDLTLYAIWEPILYSVDFDYNYPVEFSELEPDPFEFEYRVDVPGLLPSDDYLDPFYTYYDETTETTYYYKVAGWTANADGSGTIYRRGDYIYNLNLAAEDEEVTLYAKWFLYDEFGLFDAIYSVRGQTFDFDYVSGTVSGALLDASLSAKPELNLDYGLGNDSFYDLGDGFIRVKETGDAENPIALYIYDKSGNPIMPYGTLTAPSAPEGSLIGTGNSDGLTSDCKASLQSLHGAYWADGLVTVGSITMLWHMEVREDGEETENLDYNDDYGFVFTSVTGVSYFISGRYASQLEAPTALPMVFFENAITDPAMTNIADVRSYYAGPLGSGEGMPIPWIT